jgi:hypothetical protein
MSITLYGMARIIRTNGVASRLWATCSARRGLGLKALLSSCRGIHSGEPGFIRTHHGGFIGRTQRVHKNPPRRVLMNAINMHFPCFFEQTQCSYERKNRLLHKVHECNESSIRTPDVNFFCLFSFSAARLGAGARRLGGSAPHHNHATTTFVFGGRPESRRTVPQNHQKSCKHGVGKPSDTDRTREMLIPTMCLELCNF